MARCLEMDMNARWTAKEMLENMEKKAIMMSTTASFLSLDGKYGRTRKDILDGIVGSSMEPQTDS